MVSSIGAVMACLLSATKMPNSAISKITTKNSHTPMAMPAAVPRSFTLALIK